VSTEKRPRPRIIRSYVWCDYHGEIHPTMEDYYRGDEEECAKPNWRSVYVASTDPKEFKDA
jgi:hypothetical protein